MRSCGFLATPLPSPCRHSVPFAFPFLASCAGVISVTVSSGPALVTFSLALLGQKMQRQPLPQNDVCSREPQTCPCLPGALQDRDDQNLPTCGTNRQNLEDLKPFCAVRAHRDTGQGPKATRACATRQRHSQKIHICTLTEKPELLF